MSALSNVPAKENKAHGGGVQNYPQSHEPAPPSIAVSNSGVFSHWCFIKTTCKPPKNYSSHSTQLKDWGKEQGQRYITQKGRFLLPRKLYLEQSWPLETSTFHCFSIPHTACVVVTTFAKLLIPEKRCEMFSSI